MATVTSNFSSDTPILSEGWTLADAALVAIGVNRLASGFNLASVEFTTTSASGKFTTIEDGDSEFLMHGTGFSLTNPLWKTTDLTLTLPAYIATLYGSVSTNIYSNEQTGTVSTVVLTDRANSGKGTITLTGVSDVTKQTSTIKSVTWEHDGATLTCSGSLTYNRTTSAIGGNYTSGKLTYSDGQAITITGINVRATSGIPDITALLAGNDVINGSTGADYLSGYAGNDTINGLAGADKMMGGLGDDTYLVDNAGDVVTEDNDSSAGGGTDLVKVGITTSGTYILTDNVEKGTLTNTVDFNLTGNGLGNVLTGNAASNVLDGLGGNDTLIGGAGNDTLTGGAGNDSMAGGAGNDTYSVDSLSDIVTEGLSGGTDLVNVSIATTGAYVLSTNVEKGTLTYAVNYNLTGNALSNVLTGNAFNNVLDGVAGADTLIGLGGDDTYVVDNAGDKVTEVSGEGADLVEVKIATAGGTYTLTDNVENGKLTNAVAFNLTGNASGNVLTGNAAANILDGGDGDDAMTGGAGNDTYVVNSLGDVVTESDGGGTDTVRSSVHYDLTRKVYLESVTLTGIANINATGNAANNILIGNAADNVLNGLGGNDTLIGGAGNDTLTGGTGNDSMAGGTGNDTYSVDSTTDVVTEGLSAGTDLVNVSIATTGTYVLASNVENGTLTNAVAFNLTGNALNNVLTGNTATNILNGGTGNDTLDGGSGNDIMTGGLGNDTYVVNVDTDVVNESAAGGTDTVQSAVNYSLATRVNLENVTLTGSASNATGNALANTLVGNDKDNSLDGGYGNDTLDGGAGNDTMRGGVGNDTYVVDTINDVVTELDAGGTDTVRSSVNYDLSSKAFLENVTLTGIANTNATGNASANTLRGNDGNNVLDGGLGVDVLIGGLGNDTYTVNLTKTNTLQDTITEALGVGIDTVTLRLGLGNVALATTSTLALGANLEQLDASETSTAKLNLVGNILDNVLIGNAAANLLSGGAGKDTLTGGLGADIFRFNTALNASTNIDTITDFVSGDKIELSAAIFKGLTVGASSIVLGDKITYGAGILSYDADGLAGIKEPIAFALLGTGTHPALSGSDFKIIA